MDVDLEDDWLVLRGPPRPPPPKDVIGHLVYLSGDQEVSPRIPIYHQEGEPEAWMIPWTATKPALIDRIRVLVGEEVVWEQDIRERPFNAMGCDTINLDLRLGGLRTFFDRFRSRT